MAARRSDRPEAGNARLDDGALIHYQHYRHSSSDKCLLLVHSLAQDHQFWRLVAPALAEKASVVAIDLRGHGQSSKSAGPYSIALFAQDLKKVVDQLGYSGVVVAGASLGGCVALQFALDYPEQTVALGLIDTTSWYGDTASEDWQKRAEKAKTDGLDAMVQFQASRWFSESFRSEHPDEVAQCVSTFLSNDLEAYAATCLALGGFNASSRLQQIKVPTAIVVGADDYATPVAMAEYMHESISGSTLTVIPDACHLTPVEAPTVIIDALSKLISKAG